VGLGGVDEIAEGNVDGVVAAWENEEDGVGGGAALRVGADSGVHRVVTPFFGYGDAVRPIGRPTVSI